MAESELLNIIFLIFAGISLAGYLGLIIKTYF